MVKGLYAAYTGMLSEQKRLDIVSNNIANSATVGYKKEGVTNQAFKELLAIKTKDASVGADQSIGRMSLGTKLGEVYTNHGQGSLRETGNTFDLAISGAGFFQIAVADKDGNETIKYTRDGSFKIDSTGYILDSDGNHLVGPNGYVRVPDTAGSISIDETGMVLCNNVEVDQIELKDFADYNYIEKYGNNLYQTVDGAEEKDATGGIMQGYLEQSNVQTIEEMVNMITITRAYESNQKVMNTMDNMLDKVVNQVGSV